MPSRFVEMGPPDPLPTNTGNGVHAAASGFIQFVRVTARGTAEAVGVTDIQNVTTAFVDTLCGESGVRCGSVQTLVATITSNIPRTARALFLASLMCLLTRVLLVRVIARRRIAVHMKHY
jgi:hypothetical protein